MTAESPTTILQKIKLIATPEMMMFEQMSEAVISELCNVRFSGLGSEQHHPESDILNIRVQENTDNRLGRVLYAELLSIQHTVSKQVRLNIYDGFNRLPTYREWGLVIAYLCRKSPTIKPRVFFDFAHDSINEKDKLAITLFVDDLYDVKSPIMQVFSMDMGNWKQK